MKKLLALALSLVLIFCFAACGNTDATSSEETSSAAVVVDTDEIKLIVENAVKATAELDYEKIDEYYIDPIITKEIIDSFPENFARSMTLYVSVLTGEEVEISVGDEGTTATATLDVTVPDFYALVNSLSSQMFAMMEGVNPEEMDIEQIAQLQDYSYTLLNGVLESDDCPTKTSSIDIELELVDGAWKISDSDELYDVLLLDLEMVVGYIAQY